MLKVGIKGATPKATKATTLERWHPEASIKMLLRMKLHLMQITTAIMFRTLPMRRSRMSKASTSQSPRKRALRRMATRQSLWMAQTTLCKTRNRRATSATPRLLEVRPFLRERPCN